MGKATVEVKPRQRRGKMDVRVWFDKHLAPSPTGCLLWTGRLRDRCGYGEFWFDGRQQLAHRVAWQLVNGSIPPEVLVLHRCDTPACRNVQHLFLGTHRINSQDAFAKGRRVSPRGEANGLAKLTRAAVSLIRAETNPNISELARRFGVSRRAIQFARMGATWR